MGTKLVAEDVQAIFDARCQWNCPRVRCHISKQLSRYFEVSRKTIRDIWQGRTWTEVTGLPNRKKSVLHSPGSIDYVLYEWAETEFVEARLFYS